MSGWLNSYHHQSLEQNDGLHFYTVLDQILRCVTVAGDDTRVWQNVISVLRRETRSFLAVDSKPQVRGQAEDLLHQARIAIDESMRRQHAAHIVRQSIIDEQVSWMAARFLVAMDEGQIFETLQAHLPNLGIRRVEVAFFQAEQDDPVAWSVLAAGRASEGAQNRFPSREFPPTGLGPAGEPFQLALLPLLIGKDQAAGFVAFDTDALGLCATIVRQLAAALRSARLYREAVSGRRLAEEASRLKSRFLSTVSHELRTPLNLIVGLSDMLLEGLVQGELSLPQPYRQDLERVHVSAQHLDGLIRDVLDLARWC